jgi:hypothetical protein
VSCFLRLFESFADITIGYCGNTLDSTSVLATTQADCSFICPGNQYEYCGAGNRLEMYKLTPVSSSSSSSSSSLSTNNAVVATSTSSSSTPATPPTTTSTSTSQSTTVQTTTSSSSQRSTTTTSASSSSSSSSSSSLSSSTTSSQVATYTGPPVTSQGNVNFTYYSCVSEPSSGRLLPSQVENNGTYMTIEKCLSDCWMYQYAGVEYGRECWCGNSLNTGTGGSLNVSDSNCGFTCPGNSSEFCGSGSHLSLYWFDVKKAMMNNGTLKAGS